MKLLVLSLLLAIEPEQCLTPPASVTVEHGGKTYALASEACREQFLGDPERYAQLYDALLELQAQGRRIQPPSKPSLVPS